MIIQFKPVMTSEDIDKMCNLANIIWHEHFTSIIGEQQVNYMLEKFQSPGAIKKALSEGYLYFTLYEKDEMIGYTGIKADIDKKELFLSKIYIERTHRGNGYSRQVIDFLSGMCESMGLNKICLTVNRFNDNSINIYRKLGFVIVRSQISDIGNGFVMDDYVMEKDI